jgi:hypothetical protein
MTSGEEEKEGTDNPTPDDGFPADVVKEGMETKSDIREPAERGGEIRVTAAASELITIYYNAEIIERRKAIFRLNRGSTSTEVTDGE